MMAQTASSKLSHDPGTGQAERQCAPPVASRRQDSVNAGRIRAKVEEAADAFDGKEEKTSFRKLNPKVEGAFDVSHLNTSSVAIEFDGSGVHAVRDGFDKRDGSGC